MKKDDTWIRSVCDQCRGDCGILVHRVDGVVVDIKGDPDCPNTLGKICAKGYAGIMNLYDPSRVLTPLKRTNPEKGLGIDPKWVPISWDEAMDTMVEKLSKVMKEDPRKVSFAAFDNYGMWAIMPSWLRAFGSPNYRWYGFYCGNYLHSCTYLTNGTFHCDHDIAHVKYLMLFGNQTGFGAGLNPNLSAQTVAAARKKGLKVVAIDPICNHAASKADEWVPIRPGTDSALTYGMIDVLLNELGIYDQPFLKKYTNGPYLVQPDGYHFRRDGKPLVWDAAEGKAKPYDAEVADYALEGSYTVDGIECKPAFQLLKEHVHKYTPEIVSKITTVPAATIRRLAEEFGREAMIGSTILVDGVELPYRPAAANFYRGAGAHKHGVAAAVGIQILNMIIGNFYVPGGHMGQNLIGPSWSWQPQQFEGLIVPSSNHDAGHGINYYTAEVKEPETTALMELYPMSASPAPNNLASNLEPEKYKLPYTPEIFLCCRQNLFTGGCDYELTAKVLKQFKFIATFSTHIDEMAEFADLVLPESTNLEKLEVLPHRLNWSHSPKTGWWYWGVRQPVVPPLGEARNWCEVLLELADRIGFLGALHENWNHQFGLKDPYKLDPAKKYSWVEVSEMRLKSQFGADKGLEWFKENGFVKIKRTVDEQYPLPWLKVRFPLYNEVFKTAGAKIKKVTEGMGIMDWDLSDYEALLEWRPGWEESKNGFDLSASNFRVPTHSTSMTAQNPWLSEVAENNPYAQRILIHTETARRRGIKNYDKIFVESAVGKVTGIAKVTEGIHPEVIGISSHFGSLAKGKPVSYGKGTNFNRLLPYDRDPVSTGVSACVAVKVYKA